MPGGAAHNSTESFTEGALGLISERLRDGKKTLRGALEAVCRQQHRSAGEVFHGCGTDDFAETQGKYRARQPGTFRKRLQRPRMAGGLMHVGDGETHMLVR